jgi:CubicO group peptidase (beta-lactamase class C family)
MKPVGDRGFGDFLSAPNMASGGGGMVGTVADYFRFAQALLNGGELDGVRILGEAAAAEIIRDQLGPELGESPLRLGNFPLQNLGFGYCGAVVAPARPIFGNPGNYWWGGYASTDFWIDPRNRSSASSPPS